MRIGVSFKACLYLLFILLLATGSAAAQSAPSQIEIDGLVLDQTKTRAGHEFFRQFCSTWETPAGAEAHNILVAETASPQWGSMVWIRVNDVTVVQSLLRPRDADIRDLAARSVEKVQQYVRVYLRDGERLPDADMSVSGW